MVNVPGPTSSREPVSFAGCFRGSRRGCRGRAIAFLAACEVVTRLALTQCAGYQPGGPAGETVLVPSAVGGSPRVWLLVPIAVLGGLVTGWVTRRFAPEAAGSGSDTAIREYYDACGRVHIRVAVVKILATALTIGTGGSGGREGPMIQVRYWRWATWLAGWFGFGAAGRRVLLAAGMGAGVAAVFRTPLGGTLFAAEVLNRPATNPGCLLPTNRRPRRIATDCAANARGPPPTAGWLICFFRRLLGGGGCEPVLAFLVFLMKRSVAETNPNRK